MPQIYIMAIFTISISLALWGGLIYLFTGRRKDYFWLLFLGLPLSTVANLLIKSQAILAVGRAAHVQPGLGLEAPVWFLAFQVLLTPLVEEAIKILPLLLRRARKMVSSQSNALWVGFVLGISFGLGEALLMAYAIGQNNAYDFLPWYAFTGFMSERIMACFAHGVLTAILVMGIQRGGRFILNGYLAALGLHLFLNAPTVMYQVKWISYVPYNIAIVIPFIAFAILFERMRWAVREPEDDRHGNEVIHWQRHWTHQETITMDERAGQ